MNTWEKKLGIIVPSWNTVMEGEIQRMAGGRCRSTRCAYRTRPIPRRSCCGWGRRRPRRRGCWRTPRSTSSATAARRADSSKARSRTRRSGEKIPKETGIPVAVSSAAVAEALRTLGAKRVSLASPYAPWLNERLKQYLTTAGFEVMAMQGLDTQNHSGVTNERIEALITEVDRPETQAIFVSCSNFPTLGIIEKMEQKLGKPIVASNQASMWKMLRLMGDKRAVPGAGRLFREA